MERSLWKISTRLRGTNFYINCNSSAWFDPSIVNQRNEPKCTQTLRNKTKHEFRFQWGWVSCICCEKFRHDFVAWTFALIAHQFSPFCIEFHAVTKWSQMHPNTMKRNKWWVWGPMGSIGCLNCENIRRDFVARTFALIAPVRPILHRVYCRNKMLPNAPKHYETHHNMSLGSDAVDWADLLQRILLQLCGLNFCFNCNSSHELNRVS